MRIVGLEIFALQEENSTVEEDIRTRNQFGEDVAIKILQKFENKISKSTALILETNKLVHSNIMTEKKLFVGCDRCKFLIILL